MPPGEGAGTTLLKWSEHTQAVGTWMWGLCVCVREREREREREGDIPTQTERD